MAPLHGGSSAGKSDFCCGHSLDVVGRPGLHQSGLMSLCIAGCLSPGPRKNDLTIYWALGPFVRSFTLLVDSGDIYPPQYPLLQHEDSAPMRRPLATRRTAPDPTRWVGQRAPRGRGRHHTPVRPDPRGRTSDP
jgi:hypothetical protein